MPGLLGVSAAWPDVLRLLAVPVFGWAAYRDIETRRVPNEAWLPLVALGVLALAWEAWNVLTGDASAYTRQLFLVRVGVSLLVVAPLGIVFYYAGGFGGADAKAIMVLALLFPTTPTYYLPFAAWPLEPAPLGVLSLTVLTNTVLVGLAYPLFLLARNLLTGNVGLPMVVGRPVPVERLTREYGKLLETAGDDRAGPVLRALRAVVGADALAHYTGRGLDIDALRMYLRWRDATLADLRADPDRFRDPRSLPLRRYHPGDGSMAESGPEATADRVVLTDGSAADDRDGGASGNAGGGTTADADEAEEPVPAVREVDWWGARQFLGEIEGSAYGTTPEKLRGGLDRITETDAVWITPGTPFIVPMFLGLVLALTVGDLLWILLRALGFG